MVNQTKRLKSLMQYAWEGGEPALWKASAHLKSLRTWKERVNWAWDAFAKGSMINTHEVLLKATSRKECTKIRFEKFASDYDAAFMDWMRAWDIRDQNAMQTLAQLAVRHDLNRLTPEQRAAHHHVSGKSLTDSEIKEMEHAMKEHPDISRLMHQQSIDLGYAINNN